MTNLRQKRQNGGFFEVSVPLLNDWQSQVSNMPAVTLSLVGDFLIKEHNKLAHMECSEDLVQWAQDRFEAVIQFNRIVQNEILRRNIRNHAADDLYTELQDIIREAPK